MKKTTYLIIASLLVLFMYHYAGAESWEKVVDNGFGNPSNDYAWSMAAFKGNLYVGTFNLLRGAEIWCSSSGEKDAWKKVYSARSPLSNLGVRDLYADGNRALYACTFNPGGAEILRSVNGRSWSKVERGWGLGRHDNTIRCMVRFGEYLYGGAGSKGAQLYRSKNGINWNQIETDPDFESTRVADPDTGKMITNNILIGELAVFKGQLYAFTWTRDPDIRNLKGESNWDLEAIIPESPGAFEVWRSSDGINWEKVVGQDDPYGNGMGFRLLDPEEGLANDVVTSVTVFNGRLYVGTQNAHRNSSVWRTDDGTNWEQVLDFFSLGEEFNFYVWRMITFKNKLFIGTLNAALSSISSLSGVTGAQIWASDSGEAGTFYNLVHNGFDGEIWSGGPGLEMPKNIGIRTFAVFNDTLFAGTATVPSIPITRTEGSVDKKIIAGRDIGCEIWKMIQ